MEHRVRADARRARPAALVAAIVAVAVTLAACDPLAGPVPGASGSPGVRPSASPSPSPVSSPTYVRPTPTPLPTFLTVVVKPGDTLSSIARDHETTARSIAWWNRATYPSLDPDSEAYDPDRIVVGWRLALIPGAVVDDQEPPPGPSPSPSPGASPTAAPSPTSTPVAGGPSVLVAHGRRDRPLVALTLDMGGRLEPAVDIMNWLVANRVPATIFPTGRTGSQTSVGRQVMRIVAEHPELFDLGNHSWDHPAFTDLDDAEIARQLASTEDALFALTGRTTRPWFRPPFGSHDAAVRAAVGKAGWAWTVMWDVDTIDWKPTSDGGPTADDIEARVLTRAQGGSIVLMHLGGYNTLEALPGIVSGLRDRGLEPARLSDLLAP